MWTNLWAFCLTAEMRATEHLGAVRRVSKFAGLPSPEEIYSNRGRFPWSQTMESRKKVVRDSGNCSGTPSSITFEKLYGSFRENPSNSGKTNLLNGNRISHRLLKTFEGAGMTSLLRYMLR